MVFFSITIPFGVQGQSRRHKKGGSAATAGTQDTRPAKIHAPKPPDTHTKSNWDKSGKKAVGEGI
jgi:hypothetical protein